MRSKRDGILRNTESELAERVRKCCLNLELLIMLGAISDVLIIGTDGGEIDWCEALAPVADSNLMSSGFWTNAGEADDSKEGPPTTVHQAEVKYNLSVGRASCLSQSPEAPSLLVWFNRTPASFLAESTKYPRIRDGDLLLKSPHRKAILDEITARPGLHFRELGRTTGIPDGCLQHHLRVLQYHRIILPVRRLNRILYYPASTRGVARLGGDDDRQRLLRAVGSHPGIRHRELMGLLSLKRTTLDYQVKGLVEDNLIRLSHSGRERNYYIEAVAGGARRPSRSPDGPALP